MLSGLSDIGFTPKRLYESTRNSKNGPLRRRGLSEGLGIRFSDGFLECVLLWVLKEGFSEGALRRGGLQEELRTPFGEHDPLDVC